MKLLHGQFCFLISLIIFHAFLLSKLEAFSRALKPSILKAPYREPSARFRPPQAMSAPPWMHTPRGFPTVTELLGRRSFFPVLFLLAMPTTSTELVLHIVGLHS